jgi:hypothetical protein
MLSSVSLLAMRSFVIFFERIALSAGHLLLVATASTSAIYILFHPPCHLYTYSIKRCADGASFLDDPLRRWQHVSVFARSKRRLLTMVFLGMHESSRAAPPRTGFFLSLVKAESKGHVCHTVAASSTRMVVFAHEARYISDENNL